MVRRLVAAYRVVVDPITLLLMASLVCMVGETDHSAPVTLSTACHWAGWVMLGAAE